MDHPTENPFKVIAEAARVLDRRRKWERDNRLALLWVHAQVGVSVGVLMMINGTATTFEAIFGYDVARWYTSVPALMGGLLLACGLLGRPRRLRLEITGLVVLALWDLGMAIGFVKSLHDAPPGLTPKAYPIPVYVGYLELLGVHLWSLVTRSRRTT